MKAGTFNIHDYIGKLYENVNEKDLTKSLNEEDEKSSVDNVDGGIIIPEEGKKAYDWLKREYQKGKNEVKVEMSSHTFKPGYDLDTNQKSIKDFKPGMYGNAGESKSNTPSVSPFPETKFPGSETKKDNFNKKENESSKEPKKEFKKDSSNPNNIKVEAKTKKDNEDEDDE